jgi:hypothetical protein
MLHYVGFLPAVRGCTSAVDAFLPGGGAPTNQPTDTPLPAAMKVIPGILRQP